MPRRRLLSVFALFSIGCPRPSSEAVAPLDFRDVVSGSGVSYGWSISGSRPLNILQTSGNGCALLDADGDGNLDLLLVGRTTGLFLGDGHGKFRDVSAVWGLSSLSGSFLGCAVGDVDGDGHPDVYLSGYREGRLLRNVGGHRFEDVTTSWGLKPQPWGTSAAFAELTPGSKRLDLVICNYARFGKESGTQELCDAKDRDGKMVQTSCGPRQYEPLFPTLWRNEGGRFVEEKLPGTTGRALGVAVRIDPAGKRQISFANDEMSGDLLEKTGAGWKNLATQAGVALDRNGNVHGGMGTDWGDADGDGTLDLVVATFQNEPKSLYMAAPDGTFSDATVGSGVAAATRPYVAFGTGFLDFDNDGWLDLIFANGHVQDNIERIDATTTYRQPTLLLRGTGGGGRFENVSAKSPDLAVPIVGRGLCTGDFDNDGLVDVVVADSEGTPHLLHNESRKKNHWLGITLVGKTCNRDAYGAIVTATAGERKLVRHCHTDGSYLSASEKRLHFGLGSRDIIDSLNVAWPDGKAESFPAPKIDGYVTLTQGTGK